MSGSAFAAGSGRAYLLVFDGGSSSRRNLPSSGEVIIGRAHDADLVLHDHSASRRHARLALDGGAATLIDLQSHSDEAELRRHLEGETGAGKEAVAVARHEWSPRREQPLVNLNCATATATGITRNGPGGRPRPDPVQRWTGTDHGETGQNHPPMQPSVSR